LPKKPRSQYLKRRGLWCEKPLFASPRQGNRFSPREYWVDVTQLPKKSRVRDVSSESVADLKKQ